MNEQLGLYQPRVVVKFLDGIGLPYDASVATQLVQFGIEGWQDLVDTFGELELLPMFAELGIDTLNAMRARASENDPTFTAPDLSSFFVIPVPADVEPESLAAAARAIVGVESAYVEGGPTEPPVNAADDPRAANQGYLGPAPIGIDARHAWTKPGGDGAGQAFVDLERGWTLNHEDLAAAGISIISGLNQAFFGHGTSVLGEVVASDNTLGGIGIVPAATCRVVSQHRTATVYDTADAILSAAALMNFGDVLLLEAQTRVGGSTFLPVEVELAAFAAIVTAVGIGITVVEAAGNGSNNLDSFTDASGAAVLRRGTATFRESGAIMVGAASSSAPHSRLSFSNFGTRIDCYGWGENIDTAGDGWTGNLTNTYTGTFGGTSGASPIVTGAALAVQGMMQARFGRRYDPAHLRALLTDAGTASANPPSDQIGVMPDLRMIATDMLRPWVALDTNPATTAIAAAGDGALYQRHTDGSVWRYTGTPIVGWEQLDGNAATTSIVAARGGHLYQLRSDGGILRYTGVPLVGWELLDANPATTAIAVAPTGALYQLHGDGSIWRYTGVPMTGWEALDVNPATTSIAVGGGDLYQLHSDGSIWRFTGTPLTGWECLDANPATSAIAAADGGALYQLHNNGRIWRYTGPPMTGWQLLDVDPLASTIAAGDGNTLFRLDSDGTVWSYAGRGLASWRLIDAFPDTIAIAPGGGHLVYQLHADGSIWRLP
jgi:hypothetical protein